MNKKIELSFLIILFAISNAIAQNKGQFNISGTVKDAQSGETIIGAGIINVGQSLLLTNTNGYGFYSIKANAGMLNLSFNFSGYNAEEITLNVTSDTIINISLQIIKQQSNDIVISSKRKTDNITKPIMGVERINMAQINKLPVIFGERDILKTIQLMPGIKAVGEGSAGFNVRGGNADQNLILLDEAPVYNASHLLGFFSTFNSDAIKDAAIFKGGMPAQYGGRLSSVIDIKMKDGNAKKLDVAGGIGLIASRINISAPIVKNKGSFSISARRTYADVFLALQKDTGQGKRTLYFYDLNLKANYNVTKKDRIFLSGYFGKDFLKLNKNFGANWGNATGTLRWNHIFKNNLFSNTSLIYSAYNYEIDILNGETKFNGKTNIIDYNFKQDFDWNITNKSKLRFGANVIRHLVDPGTVKSSSSLNILPTQKRLSIESAFYVSHEWKPTPKLEITYGVRGSNLAVKGAGKFYEFNAQGLLTKTLTYKKGETVKSYFNVEPRFSTSYKLSNFSSLKASYNKNVQNLHLMTNSTSANPTDVWLPSTNNIKPELAQQVALGYYKDSKDGEYEFSSEIYYKDLRNQIEYRNGADVLANDFVEGDLLYGKGRAYGLEFMARKKTGRLTGWVGYTISKAEKQFDQLNDKAYFNARQDRTHDISIVAMYDLNKKWNMSGTWVYNTGSAVTFPSGKYTVNNRTEFLYTTRNGYRMPAYHRLDFAVNFEPSINKKRNYKSSWSFGIYNMYGRENAFSITFRENKDNRNITEAVRTSLFRYIPSVTWNFKF